MSAPLLQDLADTMAGHGFRPVRAGGIADATLLLKRQTWNSNRAIVVAAPAEPPADMRAYLRKLRRRVALRCGFVPLFWGIGIQVVLTAPGILQGGMDPARHVARVDNQWAIIQSVFLVDPVLRSWRGAQAWGQLLTGKFQSAMAQVLSRHFPPEGSRDGIVLSEERLRELLGDAPPHGG